MSLLIAALVFASYWVGFFAGYWVVAQVGSISFERRTFLSITYWALAFAALNFGVSQLFDLVSSGGVPEGARAARQAGSGILALEILALIGATKVAFWAEFEGKDQWLFCMPVALCRWMGPFFLLMMVYSVGRQVS